MSPKAAGVTDHTGAPGSRLDANICQRTEKRSEGRVAKGRRKEMVRGFTGLCPLATCRGGEDRQKTVSV